MNEKKDIFDLFGKEKIGITLLTKNAFEENVKLIAEYHCQNIQSEHGFFFDFSITPELKEPVIKYFIEALRWTLDYNNTFLRKPEPVNELYYTF